MRNGGNPLSNADLARDAHWFDGDGMLSGVLFRRIQDSTGETVVRPEFVNQFILTDVHIASKTSRWLVKPALPSIATLVSPLASLLTVLCTILRTAVLILLSQLPGSQWAIKKISVANTAIFWHDGRALATCESGPPMRVMLPGLETVGWYDGKQADGEIIAEKGVGFGDTGLTGWMKEWTTGHPKVDPVTGELIAYHNTFLAPYVHYSTIPSTHHLLGKMPLLAPKRILNAPVPGVSGARMMHDFGVSLHHTVIMDLPLSLNPFNLARNLPVVAYDPTAASRFGVFPRYRPDLIKWFETKACCIFHTANTWDTFDTDPETDEAELSVNLLACRLTSASLVYSAGNLAAPKAIKEVPAVDREDEQCRLYYYQFPFAELSPPTSPVVEDEGSDDEDGANPFLASVGEDSKQTSTPQPAKSIRHEFALSAIPFEFPTMKPSAAMSAARFIYGCSTTSSTGFSASLGKGVKISHIAKIDALELIRRGKENPPEHVRGCVDTRSIEEICSSEDPEDPIQVFAMPKGWYAQEASFVARVPANVQEARRQSEDDGFLMCYVFDENQIDPSTGMARDDASSELWIIDAKDMKDVVCRIKLPQRVPYGLHGNWFTESMIQNQRDVVDVRSLPVEPELELMDDEQRVQSPTEEKGNPFEITMDNEKSRHLPRDRMSTKKKQAPMRKWSPAWRAWMACREAVEKRLA